MRFGSGKKGDAPRRQDAAARSEVRGGDLGPTVEAVAAETGGKEGGGR